jgi:hypothetical protein
MKYLTIFVFLLIPLLTLLSSQNANALLVGKTDDQLYNEHDVILIGKITKAEGRFSERVTDYTISAEKYLKNDLGEQLQLSSSGKKDSNLWVEDEPIFDVGGRVLLYLVKNGNSYQISPYSHVLGKEEMDLKTNLPEDKIQSPLKQFKSGIAPKDVTCKQGLELVMKKSNGQPICVKGTSVKTLILRNYIPEYNGFGGEVPTELSIDNTEVGSKEIITKESKFPLWYRLSEAQRIVTESFGKLPITGVGIDIHGELEISIHEDELKKIPNAKEYYEQLFKDMIPYEVPIKIEFGHVIPVNGLNDESSGEKNTFFADKDDALKQEILTQLRKEPKNLNDGAKEFILSEALSDKRVSDLLGETKYQIFWTINSELGESSIRYFYGITFQLNEKDLVSIVYDLQQEKITSVESDEVFGSYSGEEIPSIKISKVDGFSELAIQFRGWTKKPNQEIVLTVTAPDGNIISTGKISPMNNGTFADAITTGGPLWKQQDGTYLVTVQQGEDHINMANFEFDLKDGKIIKEK